MLTFSYFFPQIMISLWNKIFNILLIYVYIIVNNMLIYVYIIMLLYVYVIIMLIYQTVLNI